MNQLLVEYFLKLVKIIWIYFIWSIMKKLIVRNLFAGLLLSLGFFWWIILLVKAANLTVTSGSPLTASNWNNMVTNFFWWSGSGWIYYNGKVWIWTSSPNKSLHIKTSAWTNAELDLQSWELSHWAIYHDESSQDLKIRNWVNKVSITNWWALNAIWWLCINWDCKTAWNQVWSSVSNSYTGTCDSAHKWATWVISDIYKICNWVVWIELKKLWLWTEWYPATSCLQILQANASSPDGIYYIKIWANILKTRCDMINWGRTMAVRSGWLQDHLNVAAVWDILDKSQTATWKLSDDNINALTKSVWYKLCCNWYCVSIPGTCIFGARTTAAWSCLPSPWTSWSNWYWMHNYDWWVAIAWQVNYGVNGQNGCRNWRTAWSWWLWQLRLK